MRRLSRFALALLCLAPLTACYEVDKVGADTGDVGIDVPDGQDCGTVEVPADARVVVDEHTIAANESGATVLACPGAALTNNGADSVIFALGASVTNNGAGSEVTIDADSTLTNNGSVADIWAEAGATVSNLASGATVTTCATLTIDASATDGCP